MSKTPEKYFRNSFLVKLKFFNLHRYKNLHTKTCIFQTFLELKFFRKFISLLLKLTR